MHRLWPIRKIRQLHFALHKAVQVHVAIMLETIRAAHRLTVPVVTGQPVHDLHVPVALPDISPPVLRDVADVHFGVAAVEQLSAR